MSLTEFQRALSDLISTPELALSARVDAPAVLSLYDLSEREHRRLSAMLRDRGMSANCTLYRVMRLTPIYSVMPLTCAWLGERLRPELDAFWRATQDATIQYGREARAFSAWLETGIATGRLEHGPLEDALRFELACFEVKTAPRVAGGVRGEVQPRVRWLRLSYDLEQILEPSPARRPAKAGSPTCVVIDGTAEELQVSVVGEERSARCAVPRNAGERSG